MPVLTSKRGIRACYGFDKGDIATTYSDERLKIDHIDISGTEGTIIDVTVYTKDGRKLDWTSIKSYEKPDPAADFAIQVMVSEKKTIGGFAYEFGPPFNWSFDYAVSFLEYIEKAIDGKIRAVMPEGIVHFDRYIPRKEIIESAYRSISKSM